MNLKSVGQLKTSQDFNHSDVASCSGWAHLHELMSPFGNGRTPQGEGLGDRVGALVFAFMIARVFGLLWYLSNQVFAVFGRKSSANTLGIDCTHVFSTTHSHKIHHSAIDLREEFDVLEHSVGLISIVRT